MKIVFTQVEMDSVCLCVRHHFNFATEGPYKSLWQFVTPTHYFRKFIHIVRGIHPYIGWVRNDIVV